MQVSAFVLIFAPHGKIKGCIIYADLQNASAVCLHFKHIVFVPLGGSLDSVFSGGFGIHPAVTKH